MGSLLLHLVQRLTTMMAVWKALFLLSTISLISCFTDRRVERAASPSAHTTAYYSMPYTYSYYPYSTLLLGRKKRSASAEPHYGGYGYGYSYGYGYPYSGYGYYGRKKRSALLNPIMEAMDTMVMDIDTLDTDITGDA